MGPGRGSIGTLEVVRPGPARELVTVERSNRSLGTVLVLRYVLPDFDAETPVPTDGELQFREVPDADPWFEVTSRPSFDPGSLAIPIARETGWPPPDEWGGRARSRLPRNRTDSSGAGS